MSTGSFTDRIDVVSFGEIFVDLFPEIVGVPLRHARGFTMHLGGAPANVAVGLARLRRACAMMGGVGADEFGAFLKERLYSERVRVDAVAELDSAKTAVVFVAIFETGERAFHFIDGTTADKLLSPGHLDLGLIARSRIFHFGSNLLTRECTDEATHCALDTAHASECLISFDANLRLHLWRDEKLALYRTRRAARRAHLIKVSEEENRLLAQTDDPVEAYQRFYKPGGVSALVVTHGPAGATLVTPSAQLPFRGRTVDVVDTTGAGDGFVAGLLAGLSIGFDRDDVSNPVNYIRELSASRWRPHLALATYCAARVCTRIGATTAMPRAEEVPWRMLGFEELSAVMKGKTIN